MKTIYSLCLLTLLTSTAHADSQKAIYCEDNQFARDGGTTMALFRPLDDGSVKVSAYTIFNLMGQLIVGEVALPTFQKCELSLSRISCVTGDLYDGGVQTMELGTKSSPNKLSYKIHRLEGRTDEKTFALEPKNCSEVEGVELAMLARKLEVVFAKSKRELPADAQAEESESTSAQ